MFDCLFGILEVYLQLPIKSMPITTKVVSSNLIHGELYSIRHYVIKFVSDLRQVGGFLLFSPTNKTDLHDIANILLKVALNLIIPNPLDMSRMLLVLLLNI